MDKNNGRKVNGLETNKNILYYMSENMFPVNNGVTVAVAGNALSLSKYNNVYLYNYVTDKFYKIDVNGMKELSINIESIFFDCVICSPILPLLNFVRKKSRLIHYQKLVGHLNDIYTYVLWRQAKLAFKLKSFGFSEFKSLLKLPLVYLVETYLVHKSDAIIVQTKKEVEIYSRLFIPKKKALRLPNGTQFDNTSSEFVAHDNRFGIGIVASFNSTYMKVTRWFLTNVWLEVVRIRPDTKLYVVGKNAIEVKNYVREMMPEAETSIIIEPYYDDIRDFYMKRSVIVSPIFKGFGLINKTVEAMHCGCITIGDKAAFNGIEAFEHEVHGYQTDKAEDFVSKIINAIDNPDLEMRHNASSLIELSFSWDDNAKKILEFLDEGIK